MFQLIGQYCPVCEKLIVSQQQLPYVLRYLTTNQRETVELNCSRDDCPIDVPPPFLAADPLPLKEKIMNDYAPVEKTPRPRLEAGGIGGRMLETPAVVGAVMQLDPLIDRVAQLTSSFGEMADRVCGARDNLPHPDNPEARAALCGELDTRAHRLDHILTDLEAYHEQLQRVI